MPEGTVQRLPRVYIVGPMRGYPEFNFPAFDAARDLAKSRGWYPISPADMDREAGLNEKECDTVTPSRMRAFVKRDVEAIQSLKAEEGDAIALLPGWELSRGALAEFALARWLGLKMLDAWTMEPFVEDELWKLSFADLTYHLRNTLRGAA
jgi:hypothetical protein